MNFPDLIKTALPWIGAAATGNVPALITLAAGAVGNALGTEVKPDAQSISTAIAGATPDQMIALKLADNEFAVKMRQLGIQEVADLARMDLENTKDARARDNEITRAGRYNWRSDVLAILAVGGLVLCVWFIARDAGLPERAVNAIMFVAGVLASAVRDVYGFEFGSSRTNKDKDATINQLTKG